MAGHRLRVLPASHMWSPEKTPWPIPPARSSQARRKALLTAARRQQQAASLTAGSRRFQRARLGRCSVVSTGPGAGADACGAAGLPHSLAWVSSPPSSIHQGHDS